MCDKVLSYFTPTKRSTSPDKPSVRNGAAEVHSLSTMSPVQPSSPFHGFTTSAARIQRAGNVSVDWDPPLTCEGEALKFISNPPSRDVHQNRSKHIFRVLVIDYDRRKQPEPASYSSIVEAAKDALWIDEPFCSLFDRGTSGSEVTEANGGLGFIAQSPSDDDDPHFSFALTSFSSHTPGHSRERDWTCLYFGSPQLNHEWLKNRLEQMEYPQRDSDVLPPDFMILPTTILLWQVDQIAEAVARLKRKLMELDEKNTNEGSEDGHLRSFDQELSKIRKLHYQTQLRHAFALDFALKLVRCFDRIEKSYCVGSETQPKSPHALRGIVQGQKDVLGNIGRTLDNLPLRIEAQQSMMISTHSYYVADAARRDGTAMLTIAIVTLVFLPGTFVAAVFSMSVFNWQVEKQDSGGTLVSHWIWLYFAIDIPLTLLIIGMWLWWKKWRDMQHSENLKRHLA